MWLKISLVAFIVSAALSWGLMEAVNVPLQWAKGDVNKLFQTAVHTNGPYGVPYTLLMARDGIKPIVVVTGTLTVVLGTAHLVAAIARRRAKGGSHEG